LLTRKNGNGNSHIETDANIRERVSRTDSPDVKFIVVATPVEEIGRDHDFDWVVIEPSSTQSIVQTAGRVNRHRRLPRTAPNVGILQYNLQKVRRKNIVFTRPGLETRDWPYNARGRGPDNHNHNLERLIDWSQFSVLDAGLRFRNHPFARLDDENLNRMIELPLKILCMEAKPRDWMVESTYADYPLRDKKDDQQTWRLTVDDVFEVLVRRKTSNDWIPRNELVKRHQAVPNAWLAWSREDLAAAAIECGIRIEEAFRLTTQYRDVFEQGFEWDEAYSGPRKSDKGLS
jgi:CRISPR-associated endonuclease/helicase Cas3